MRAMPRASVTGRYHVQPATLYACMRLRIRSLMRFVPLIFVLLAACAAPPTLNELTSRSITRNCEAQGDVAANLIRQESVQVVKEGSATNQNQRDGIESQAQNAKRDAFKSCMLKYAV